MDTTRAAQLMSAMWPDVECAVCKVEDGILLDAAVMAAIMCALKEELVPLEDSLAAAIIDVMETLLLGMPRPKGFVFIPCTVNEVRCLKDFLLGDAVHCYQRVKRTSLPVRTTRVSHLKRQLTTSPVPGALTHLKAPCQAGRLLLHPQPWIPCCPRVEV
ncbi:hypothetical protein VaNZ11_005956 [Volvox africanus]|uniref:Uncharacterized protein n=1 Tax=Volvox africanus TaxID=51714 RepID=A0ABQ5S071_9CHLO|nr:hypothetical protein VaNZ11_005956 [Volvox africanus]